ncbi:hypothetical protein KQX54_015165 [Cotesia glomerata]|uniref:Uncharacterized protein n=1 Tax=Cotesia glomerata TaxID=32391 RepID=A0AAV7HTK9_COTGL|nr:hypothetical protein KQX54_015165 [Cotesia glomerata]
MFRFRRHTTPLNEHPMHWMDTGAGTGQEQEGVRCRDSMNSQKNIPSRLDTVVPENICPEYFIFRSPAPRIYPISLLVLFSMSWHLTG